MNILVFSDQNTACRLIKARHLILIACLTAGGCSSVSVPPEQNRPILVEESSSESPTSEEALTAEEDATPKSESDDKKDSAASNSAALLLLAKSETLRAKGQGPQAIGLVERAIRLEPRNGALWIQLGRLNFEGGELARAEQYARRGIALSKSPDSQRANLDLETNESRRAGWLLLADISEAQGDVEGAQQIRSRWLNGRG